MKKIVKTTQSKKTTIATFIASTVGLGLTAMMVYTLIAGIEPVIYPGVGIASFTPRLIEKFGYGVVGSFAAIEMFIITLIGYFNTFFEIKES